ncbi:MAG: type IX secretion system protein PorQ [Prolixibacteraceae bacterium]|jgi:hypothetical protein|nr:type IX secretion system protein PorQ [Prolixibacteraceae bacterium]
MNRLIYILIFILFAFKGFGQFGGGSTYDFLNLSASARINALGGNQVGLLDETELGFTYYNPATLRPAMHNGVSVNYIDYVADIRIGYAAYGLHFDNIGTFAAGMQFVNYGSFIEADEYGNRSGNSFSAGDYALNIIYSRNVWNNITVGANLKPIYSAYENYNSFGIASDIGVTYADSSGNFNAGLVAKNMGMQLTTYNNEDGSREPLPFDLQAGFSQKLAHAPFRFNVTLQNLTNWKLTDKNTWDYDNKTENQILVGSSDDFFKQFLRHAILGVEFIPSDNFLIGIGYNFQRRFELSISDRPGAVGLSGGFTIKVSKFRVSYAIASYHLSGTSNTFSITTNLSEFIR